MVQNEFLILCNCKYFSNRIIIVHQLIKVYNRKVQYDCVWWYDIFMNTIDEIT